MRGHIWFIGVSTVHPGQMVTEINFKFYKGLKGIKIILAPCDIIILDKLDKTVKIDIFIKVISRDMHSVTLCLLLWLDVGPDWLLAFEVSYVYIINILSKVVASREIITVMNKKMSTMQLSEKEIFFVFNLRSVLSCLSFKSKISL